MFISIIIPNYNHESYLQKRIDSVINQTFQDFEVIILDDCSTDNSREIIKEFALNPFVSHLIFNNTNSNSVFKQWEKGVLLAKGEWIWIAESDDYAHPDFLAKCVKKISRCLDAGICFVASQPIDENNNELPIAIMETPFDKYVTISKDVEVNNLIFFYK